MSPATFMQDAMLPVKLCSLGPSLLIPLQSLPPLHVANPSYYHMRLSSGLRAISSLLGQFCTVPSSVYTLLGGSVPPAACAICPNHHQLRTHHWHMSPTTPNAVQNAPEKKKARNFASLPAVAPSTDLRAHLRKFQPPPPSDPHSSGGPHTSVSPRCRRLIVMHALRKDPVP